MSYHNIVTLYVQPPAIIISIIVLYFESSSTLFQLACWMFCKQSSFHLLIWIEKLFMASIAGFIIACCNNLYFTYLSCDCNVYIYNGVTESIATEYIELKIEWLFIIIIIIFGSW